MKIIVETTMERIPKSCARCPIFVYEQTDYGYCAITEEQMASDEMKYRSCDCPLRVLTCSEGKIVLKKV